MQETSRTKWLKLRRTKSATAVSAFLAIACFRDANASIVASFNASLGTLPDSQGFQRYEDSGYPTPTVSDNSLHQYPQTAMESDEFWYVSNLNLNFSAATYSVNADLKIISSNYIADIGTGPRFGYYFDLFSTDGSGYIVGISSSGVSLATDVSSSLNNNFAVSPFDTTNGFHNYQVVAGSSASELFIDGSLVASVSRGQAVFQQAAPMSVRFGDATGLGVSESLLADYSISVVPEPVTLAVFVAGFGLSQRHRRRSRDSRGITLKKD